MILNIGEDIKDYFSHFWTSITIGNVITLIIGLVLGFLLAVLIYCLILLIDMKKAQKPTPVIIDDITDEQREQNERNLNESIQIISNAKSQYSDCSDLKMGERINEAKSIVGEMVYDIAKVYFPDSPYPLLELSMDELLELDRILVERIDKLLDNKIIKTQRKNTIAKLARYYDLYRSIDESKMIKDAKKYHIPEAATLFNNIKNSIMVNVSSVFTKGIQKMVIKPLENRIIESIIEIIGQEVTKVYSKRVFNEIDDLDINQKIVQLSQENATAEAEVMDE